MSDAQVRAMARGALLYLTPPAATAMQRAAAAALAAERIDDIKRGLLRAGLASGPDCRFLAPLIALQHEIRAEAEAILALGEIHEIERVEHDEIS